MICILWLWTVCRLNGVLRTFAGGTTNGNCGKKITLSVAICARYTSNMNQNINLISYYAWPYQPPCLWLKIRNAIGNKIETWAESSSKSKHAQLLYQFVRFPIPLLIRQKLSLYLTFFLTCLLSLDTCLNFGEAVWWFSFRWLLFTLDYARYLRCVNSKLFTVDK